MPKHDERRNRKVRARSSQSEPYQPKPPRADPDVLWDHVEALIVTETIAESAPQTGQPKDDATKRKRGVHRRQRRRRRIVSLLDVAGSVVWVAALVKLLIGDLDRLFVSSFAPQLTWLLDMRWLLVLVMAALVLILFRASTLGIAVAYVAFYPLVLLFWKLPKMLVKRRSTLLLSSFAGIVTGFLSRAKFFIVALAVACLSGAMITMSDSPAMIAVGMCTMLLALLWWLGVTAIDLLHSGAFIRAQEQAIDWIFGFHIVEAVITPEQPDQMELKKWSVDDAKKFRDAAGNALLARRALLFWAGAVDQYRRGPAIVVLNCLLIASLLLQVVVAFAFLNYGVWALDRDQFDFTAVPDAWTFLYYSAVGMYFGEISALTPVGGLAIAVKLLNGAVGSVGVLTIIGATLMGFRAARAESASNSASDALRRKADELESLSALQFQMSLEDLQQRLLAAGWGLLGVVNWLQSKTPTMTTSKGG